jgi:DNA-binding CsgD family transcriptional regulator
MQQGRAHALTPRERDVLGYLSQGMMTGQIADKLGLADVTVKKHFSSARKRLNAATREQALAIAMASGAVSL